MLKNYDFVYKWFSKNSCRHILCAVSELQITKSFKTFNSTISDILLNNMSFF